MYFSMDVKPVLKQYGRIVRVDDARPTNESELEVTIVRYFELRDPERQEKEVIVETGKDKNMEFVVFAEYSSSNVLGSESYAVPRELALSYVQ